MTCVINLNPKQGMKYLTKFRTIEHELNVLDIEVSSIQKYYFRTGEETVTS